VLAAAAYLMAVLSCCPTLDDADQPRFARTELLPDHLPHQWAPGRTYRHGGALAFGITSSLRVTSSSRCRTILVDPVALPARTNNKTKKKNTPPGPCSWAGGVPAARPDHPELSDRADLPASTRNSSGLPPERHVWALICERGVQLGVRSSGWILKRLFRFSSIPAEIEEAAMVDGSGRIGVLLRVYAAAAAHRGLVTALIFTFIAPGTSSIGRSPSHQQLHHPRPSGGLVHAAVHCGLAAPVRRAPSLVPPFGAYPCRP